VKLNELWESYILSLLPNRPNVCLSTYHDVLLRADYHGAKVKIIHSRSKTQIGIEGIVALETKNVFHLVTVDHQMLKIEKKFCVFSISVSDFEIEIFGSNFRTAPSFRAGGRLTTEHNLMNVL